ncbi:MAG TPA: response regulator transcription factor [Spirochaetota bacterium]|nr:response regulator transcription factor [Spirochaetota bacterium]HPS85665.1 response regulator transcription factor [Spirochaetota bacterium]
MKKISIFLADDHVILREGLKHILLEDSSNEITGEAGDGREALEKIDKLKPDIAILDISMPTLSGLEASRVIRKYNKNIKIIILTRHDNGEYVRQALKNGVNGFILKDSAGDDLLKAVRDVMNGNIYLSPKIVTNIVKSGISVPGSRNNLKIKSDKELLTNREKEVLKLVAEGKSSNDIAVLLRISPKTVKVHRLNIMNKLDIRNVTELVKYAIKSGLIDI